MDKLYEVYKKYDWSGDDNWQQYLNNLYPIPTSNKVEKIRRKWYKKNKDKEFDVDFNAEEHVEKKA